LNVVKSPNRSDNGPVAPVHFVPARELIVSERFDVVVVGGGIAGLTAGLFASRYGLTAAVLEGNVPTGQVLNAMQVENFPGFPQGVAGAELGSTLQDQGFESGMDLRISQATRLKPSQPYHVLCIPCALHQ
jgi:thioredoxin reductase (NADPH)